MSVFRCVLQGPKVLFDSAKDCVADDTVRWEDDKLLVETGELVICGDYQVWILLPPKKRHGGWADGRSVDSLGGGGAGGAGGAGSDGEEEDQHAPASRGAE